MSKPHVPPALLSVLVGVTFLAALQSDAKADDIAYMTAATGQFGTIDLNTGAFTQLGSSISLRGLGEADGNLYAVDSSTLYQVNPADGSLTAVGNGSILFEVLGSTTSGLFLLDQTSLNLYSLNPKNGATTLVGPTGLSRDGVRAIGLSAGSDTLYLALGNFDIGSTTLYSLNAATGAATTIGKPSALGIGAMVFENGTLYAGTNFNTPSVYTLNPTTFVANTSGGLTFNGLAPIAPCQVSVDQAVDNPHINGDSAVDLVADRNTAVRLTGCGTDPTAVTGSFCNFACVDDGGSPTPLRKPPKPSVNGDEIDLFFTPSSATDLGKGTINTTDSSGNQQTLPVYVRQSTALDIPYVEIPGCSGPLFCYGPLDPSFALQSFAQSRDFIFGTYPIPALQSQVVGSFKGSEVLLGYLIDIRFAWLFGKAADPMATRVVALVPPDYFQYHCGLNPLLPCGTLGLSQPTIFAVLSSVQVFQSPAHEVGHTFGLHRPPPFGPGEEYEVNQFPPGNCASGFWVDRDQPISGGICFMGLGTSTQAGFNFSTSCFQDATVQVRHSWIDKPDYASLFSKLDPVANASTTSPILILAGVISEDDSVQLSPWYTANNGTSTLPVAGDYSVELVDSGSGQVVTATAFPVDFFLHPDYSGTPIHTGASPFGFALPLPGGLLAVNVKHGSTSLLTFNLSTKLLADAVASIPDAGFVRNPEELRNALQNKISAFDAQLSAGDLTGAKNKLRNDIRKHLADWLVDGYATQSPLQYTKPAILALVDELLQQRLGG